MAVPNNHSLSAEHRRHDRLLVARFAVGDATGTQEHEARDLVKRCSECAALAADITAISSTVAKLPAAARPRDFRLTAQEADRLRGSRFDRWLRTITGSGWATVRPVAAVALSVGLVMSVVGALPILGAAVNAPAETFFTTSAPIAVGQPSPVPPSDMRADSPGVQASTGIAIVNPSAGGGVESTAGGQLDNAYLQQESAPPAEGQFNPAPRPTTATKDGTQNDLSRSLPGTNSGVRDLLLLGGIAVSLFALIVLVLLYAARRRYYDPLLR